MLNRIDRESWRKSWKSVLSSVLSICKFIFIMISLLTIIDSFLSLMFMSLTFNIWTCFSIFVIKSSLLILINSFLMIMLTDSNLTIKITSSSSFTTWLSSFKIWVILRFLNEIVYAFKREEMNVLRMHFSLWICALLIIRWKW